MEHRELSDLCKPGAEKRNWTAKGRRDYAMVKLYEASYVFYHVIGKYF